MGAEEERDTQSGMLIMLSSLMKVAIGYQNVRVIVNNLASVNKVKSCQIYLAIQEYLMSATSIQEYCKMYCAYHMCQRICET